MHYLNKFIALLGVRFSRFNKKDLLRIYYIYYLCTIKSDKTPETMTNTPIPQFYIYKEGRTTNGKVLVVSPKGVKFDKLKKMSMYLALGYSVTDLQETKTITWNFNN